MKKTSLILTIAWILLMSTCITAFAEGETGSIVSSGPVSTYVIKNDGSLWGWGGMYTGNGNGYKEIQATPAKILDDVKAISANSLGGVAVKKDNTLWAWGSLNDYPIVDGGSNPDYLYPIKVMDDVKLASMGNVGIAVVKNDDTLWICGDMYIGDGTNMQANGSAGFVKVTSDVKDVFLGNGTLYFIKNDNTLWGYGDNSDGELGNMTFEDSLVPVKILDDAKKVHLFGSTAFAIRNDNSLYSWGNDGIYTENGWVEDAVSPYKVMDDVLDVTACQNGSGVLVVKTDNTLWGWNAQWNDEGKQMSPYKYADNVLAVSNGERHAAVVMGDNTLWTMGGNYRGALGYDIDTTWYSPLTKIVDNVQDAPATWAYEEVEKAIGAQLIPEDMQNNYTKPITREEFCILAIRMIEVKSDMSIDEYLDEVGVEIAPVGTFTDCDTKEVRAAKVLGITDGVGNGEFAPDNLLNREQAAKFLTTTALACGRDVTLGSPNYADLSEIADWAKLYTGYVYDINVMKGVGANKFDPQGGYQRQQAFMTMYRIWKTIDSVNPENVQIEGTETSVNTTDVSSLDSIKKEVNNQPYHTDFIAYIEGTSKDSEETTNIKYDVYYKDADIKIDTYYDDRIISNSIFSDTAYMTYTVMTMGTHYAEVLDGNWLPFRFLNIETFNMLENDPEVESFEWRYDTLDSEEVIYTKTIMKDGVLTEQWYSLKYKMPIKFHQEWTEADDFTVIDWKVTSIDENAVLDDSLFDIPSDAEVNSSDPSGYDDEVSGDTRNLLLYEVNTIANDESGIDGMMTQVFYYSDASYEILVTYFKNLLEGTADYDIYVQEGRTSIDGTINGEFVIVIVNDYMTTEPEVGMNGVNINYYE